MSNYQYQNPPPLNYLQERTPSLVDQQQPVQYQGQSAQWPKPQLNYYGVSQPVYAQKNQQMWPQTPHQHPQPQQPYYQHPQHQQPQLQQSYQVSTNAYSFSEQLSSQNQPTARQNQQQSLLTKCTFIMKTQIQIDLNKEGFYLVGSAPQLAEWRLQHAIKLHPIDRTNTQWQVCIELNTDTIIEYKYVIKGPMSLPRWEQLPSNRVLNTWRKKEVRVIEVWGDVEGSEDWVPTKGSSPEQSPNPVPTAFNSQRKSIEHRSPNSSFHSQIHHFPMHQNRVDTPSDASFIFDDMQHAMPVRQSSLTFSDAANSRQQHFAVPKSNSLTFSDPRIAAVTLDQPINGAVNYHSRKETAEHNQPFNLTRQEEANQKVEMSTVKMKKALQLAFKNHDTSVKKEAQVPVVDEEPKVSAQEPQTPIEIDYNEPILHVSYMLPYRLERSARRLNEFVAVQSFHNPTFLHGTLDHLGQQGKFNFYWVGIISTENRLTESEEAQGRKVLLEKKCFPIYMTLKEIQAFQVYYESLIKPKMHNFLNIFDDSQFIQDNWGSYVQVNQKIASKVLEVRSQIKDLKMIWVHGDQLMLAPQYIRKSFQQANLGFYFHSAFPASAVFSSLYYRREFLTSLLQADLVGFHLFEYARNFLNCCERLFNLNLDYSNGGFLSVNYHGRIVGVRVSHIGIDEEFIQLIMNSKDFKKQVTAFKDEFKIITEAARRSTLQSQGSRSSANLGLQNRLGHRQDNGGVHHNQQHQETTNISTSQSTNSLRTLGTDPQSQFQQQQQASKPIVITSIDTFTPLSGFITKLKGYQRFLRTTPIYRNKIVLIQFIPSAYSISDSGNCKTTDKYMTDSIENLHVLMSEIKQITGEIHKEFGTHCLMLQEGNPPLAKRLAVWSQAQILLIATLRDGLCLPPLEFVTVKKILGDFQNSSMVISEYAGCSNAFSGFHNFNTFDLLDICKALDTALSTPHDKKAEMMAKAYKYSSNRSFKKWVESFLYHMKQMYNPTSTVAARYIYLGLRTVSSFLTTHKVIATPLDIEACAAKFGKCHRCLILIDHEALPRKQFGRGEMHPTDQTIMDLAEITQDSRNTIALISCESRSYMQKVFNRVQNLWLAAESGYEYRINGQWQTMFKIGSKSWLKILKKIMQEYCDNVDGSCVEERNSTIVWNYKNVEEEHGQLCAKELYDQINHLIGPNAPIEIVQGNGFLEVKPVQLKKSTLLSIFLKELSDQVYSKIDFLLYVGADSSDEPVFEYLKQQTKQSTKSQYFSSDCHTNLCILGKKPSKADFYVDEIERLAVLINKLGVETKKRKKNRSYNNLNELTSSNHLVKKPSGLNPAGQSTNDLSKIGGSLLDHARTNKRNSLTNKVQSFKESLQAQIPILEQDAGDEESVLKFGRSPRSEDHSSSQGQKSRSKSNNYTNPRDRLYSIQEVDAISLQYSQHEYSKSPKHIQASFSHSEHELLVYKSKDESRQGHNQSLTQLSKAVKEQDVLTLSSRQKNVQHAVSEQIREVLKPEKESLME